MHRRAAFLFALVACGSDGGGGGSTTPPPDGPATTITSDDGRVTLDVPAGAGVDASTIRIRARSDVAAIPRAVAFAYTLEPSGLTFAKPATFRWTGPIDGLRGAATTPDIAWIEVPLLALRSYQNDADASPANLTEQNLSLDLDSGRASFEAKLSHFTDVVAEQPGVTVPANTPDHEKFAGHFAVGFLGLGQLPFGNGASDTSNAPVVSMRFWYSRQVGIPVDVGFDSASAGGAPITGGVVGTGGTLTKEGDEKRYDPPASFPLAAGVPIIFAAKKHYRFQLAGGPLDVGLSTTMTVKPAAPCPADAAILAKRSAEIYLGFLAGLSSEQACKKTAATPGPTTHSNGILSSVPESPLDILAIQFGIHRFHASTLAATYYFSLFQCGQGEVAFTVCPNPKALPPEGDFAFFTTVLGAAVPLADPANRYVYAFALDANGNPNDNYRAPANFPKDFYDDTDRWYEASYVPASGWTLTAKDAHGPTPTSFPTAARLMIKDNAMMLAVPASELSSKTIRWRATSFRHKGDFGIPPPNDWSGDVVPPVGQLRDGP